MERYGVLPALAAVLAAYPSAASAGTCALCRQALASGGRAGLIQGFYWSILLIAGVPLLIMGIVGIAVWRHRRAKIRVVR